jgi:hypothetical protein
MDPRLPTMEETPVLLPVDKLKKLSLEKFYEYQIQEFRLQGGTESLHAFLDLCFLENGRYDKNRIVWITENAYVRLGCAYGLTPDQRFSLSLWAPDDTIHLNHTLNIYASTMEEAIAALNLLAGLQDSHFKRIELDYYDPRDRICSLSGRHLENFVRNANRENSFCRMTFTRDQCRTLATSGIRTNIGFRHCEFEDEGIAFVEASAARENQESGPAKLSIWEMLLFNEANFRVFLSQHRLESLSLGDVHLRHEEICRAVAGADLQNLELPRCKLAGWSNPSGRDVVRGDCVFSDTFLTLQKHPLPSPMHCGRIRIFRDLTSRIMALVNFPLTHSLVLCVRIRGWFTLVSINVDWTISTGATL